MVTTAPEFDHRDTGTPETAWSSRPWSTGSTLSLDGVAALLVVVAHPDDETLAAGGLIATAAARGLDVAVIVASDGEASHPDSPTTAPVELRPLRRREVRAALDRLGSDIALRFLEQPDGALSVEALLPLLASSLDRRDALVVTTWSGDGHPDHVAVAEAVARLRPDRIEAPIWLWHWGDAAQVSWGSVVALALDADALDRKRSALAEHGSQIAPLSPAPGDEAILSPAMREHFARAEEVFFAPGTLGEGWFDAFYAGQRDPWGFETRWYEARKRAVLLAALPRRRFDTALEIGCSIGVTTAALADRVGELLATDIAAAPLDVARARLADTPHVRFEQRMMPRDWPDSSFDLIVLSEVGYYLDRPELTRLAELAASALTTDGVLVACHWRHPVAEYPLDGDAVHDIVRSHPGLARTVLHEEEDFVLEVFQRPPGVSVARAEGLI